MRRRSSNLFAWVCMVIVAFLAAFIVIRFVIPTVTGTITETPSGKIYTIDDVDDSMKNLINKKVERYAYTQLSDTEKEAYDRLLYGIFSYANRIDLKGCKLDMDKLQKIYACLRNDYPELFFISGTCDVYTTNNTITDCLPQYLFTKEQALSRADQLCEVRDMILAMAADSDDYGKAMVYLNYIVDTTTYDEASLNNFMKGENDASLNMASCVLGTLFNKRALCEGYSRTYQYLLNASGIDCLYITGKAGGEDHAWNYVKLDNEYYCVDVTWCDPKSDTPMKTYAYCMLRDSDFNTTRFADTPYPLPACTGIRYNYYAYNNYDLIAYDLPTLQSMFLRAYESGRGFIEFRCSNQAVLATFKQAVSDQSVFNCFDLIEEKYAINISSLNYTILEDCLVVRVNFEG